MMTAPTSPSIMGRRSLFAAECRPIFKGRAAGFRVDLSAAKYTTR
jgi:hypothetical protein